MFEGLTRTKLVVLSSEERDFVSEIAVPGKEITEEVLGPQGFREDQDLAGTLTFRTSLADQLECFEEAIRFAISRGLSALPDETLDAVDLGAESVLRSGTSGFVGFRLVEVLEVFLKVSGELQGQYISC